MDLKLGCLIEAGFPYTCGSARGLTPKLHVLAHSGGVKLAREVVAFGRFPWPIAGKNGERVVVVGAGEVGGVRRGWVGFMSKLAKQPLQDISGLTPRTAC